MKDYHSEENNSLSFSKGDLIQIYKENQGWGVGKAGGKLDIFHWNMLQPEDDSIRSKRVIQIIYIVLKDVLSFAIDDQIISSVRSLS